MTSLNDAHLLEPIVVEQNFLITHVQEQLVLFPLLDIANLLIKNLLLHLLFNFLVCFRIVLFCCNMGHSYRFVLYSISLFSAALHMWVVLLRLFKSCRRECCMVNLRSHYCFLLLFKISLLELHIFISFALSLDFLCFILINLGKVIKRKIYNHLFTSNL